jgi:hypothetical protein
VPEPSLVSAAVARKPTACQLAYLKDLAAQCGQSFSYPTTAAEASREISRMRCIRRTPPADAARERRQIADDMATRRGDHARVRDAEINRLRLQCRLGAPEEPAMIAWLGDPADFPGAFAYEHSDVPVDVTLTAWRRSRTPRARARQRRSWRALLRRLGGYIRQRAEVA